MSFLQYIPFVLLFAAATALIYGWGLWRSQRQQQDLSNLLFSKGVSRIQKALKKQKQLSTSGIRRSSQRSVRKQPFPVNVSRSPIQTIFRFSAALYAPAASDI